MAEILAVIGLASNVVQFVELGVKLISKYRKAYVSASGQNVRDQEVQADVEGVRAIAKLLTFDGSKGDSAQLSDAEKQLKTFCTTCVKVASELVALLESVKSDGSGNRAWRALKETFETTNVKQLTISHLQERLERLQAYMLFSMVAILRDQQSQMMKSISKIVTDNESLRANTLENFQAIRSDLGKTLALVPPASDANDPKKFRHQELVALSSDLLGQLMPQLQTLATASDTIRRQQRTLASLSFQDIRSRYWSIKEHHANTFEWIFRPPEHKFVTWLKSGQEIFWVCGKAGSGKSTLMRFLVEHGMTKSSLQHWADGQDLVIASHYFWNAGTPIQKSQNGLLRTLLYQIFSQCPHLIQKLCPDRWSTAMDIETDPWTDTELHATFQGLSKEDTLSTKFCFFIDGLDEYTAGQARYHGSYAELIEPMKQLSRFPFIKICVSSRPWTAFDTAFGKNEDKIYLETLTERDIKKYINDNLGKNDDFKALMKRDHRVEAFVDRIADRAKGVFLWVYLVVDSLLNGLSAEDDFTDLQTRLEQLPPDLEKYFRHMLESIESVYWDQAVRIFRVTIDANQTLPILAYEFLDYEKKDPSYAINMSLKAAGELDLDSIYRRMKKRLNARCKDLLHITPHPEKKLFMQHQVDFLHRTVRDFFHDTNALSDIMSRRKSVEFDSILSLGRIMLALVKTTHSRPGLNTDINRVLGPVDGLMYYAWKMESSCNGDVNYLAQRLPSSTLEDMFELLDELDRTNTTYMQRGGSHWTNARDPPKGAFKEYQQKSFLASAIQARLALYVWKKLEEDPRQLSHKRGRPLLDYALRPTIVTPLEFEDLEEGPDRRIVKLLLERDADPNQEIYIYEGQTPWQLFLRNCYDHSKSTEFRTSANDMYEVMRLMLIFGADGTQTFKSATETVVTIPELMQLSHLSAREINELNRIIEEKRHLRSRNKCWFSWLY